MLNPSTPCSLFSWRVATLALVATVVACSVSHGQGAPAAGNMLRYGGQPGSQFGYAVEITVDAPGAIETYKGNISYTVNSIEGDLLKITYNGGLNKTETAKQQATGPRGNSPFFGPPAAPPGPFQRNPFMGLEQTSNVIVMTPLGEIRSLDGTSQLPYLLGNLSLLPLEQLSEGNEPVWQVNRGAAISEADDQRGEPAFSPFARPKSEKTTAASASESFRIEPSPGNLVVVAKTFQMKSPGAEESLEINGSGKWTFNRGLGVPEKLDFQQKLVVNVQNVAFSIPITIKYQRYDDAAWKKMQEDARLVREKAKREAAEAKAVADAKAKADAVIPLTAQQKQALIVDVKSADFWRMKGALEKLAAKDPKEPDAQLGALIYPLTSHESPFIRTAAFGAIKKWAPDLHDKAALNYRYRMSTEAVEPPDRPVTKDTPLPVGLIVCARSQYGWRGAEVREVLSNGKVKVKYGGNSPPWDLEVARADLQLAPDEVDQPNLDEQALALVRGTGGASAAGASAFRTWTDNTGTFRLEAEFLGVADGKVRLRRKDSREIAVPLDRLSAADKQEVERLQQPAAPSNPFAP
jgi:hypothetical protein